MRSHYARDLVDTARTEGSPRENKDEKEVERRREGKTTGHAVNDYRHYPRCWLTATNVSVQARRELAPGTPVAGPA